MSTLVARKRGAQAPQPVVTPVATTTAQPVVKRITVDEIEQGDVFSEISHYVFNKVNGKKYCFNHLEGVREIFLDKEYVENLLSSADQFHKEEVVGREDKMWTEKQIKEFALTLTAEQILSNPLPRAGDIRVKGIRSIWSDIHSTQVFSVCFDKQAKALTQKRIKELLDERANHAVGLIETAKNQKKSMLEASRVAVQYLQENPISSYEEPEERILRGYKVQFESVNGYYDVIDMDLEAPNNRRKVNINEIKWLGFNGVKYIVEK